MRTFDASAEPGRWVIPAQVVNALEQVQSRLGDLVLVGSWARDVVLVLGAGLDPGRATDDLDVAVATPSLAHLDALLGDLGPRGGHGVRVSVQGQAVDILPFGDLAHDGLVRPTLDDELDVHGMLEAYEGSDRLRLSTGVTVPVASLESMLLLKIIAWDVRTPGTQKDAADLDRLLEATSCGTYADETFEDDEAMEACEFEVERAGVYRCGRQLDPRLAPGTRRRLAEALESSRMDRLAALMSRHRVDERRDQLQLLRRALRL